MGKTCEKTSDLRKTGCEKDSHGRTPLMPDYDAGRLLRDSRLYTVGAGTQEIRRMLIGRGFNEMYDEERGKAIMQ